MGKNFRIIADVKIGANSSEPPTINGNVYICPEVKILKNRVTIVDVSAKKVNRKRGQL